MKEWEKTHIFLASELLCFLHSVFLEAVPGNHSLAQRLCQCDSPRLWDVLPMLLPTIQPWQRRPSHLPSLPSTSTASLPQTAGHRDTSMSWEEVKHCCISQMVHKPTRTLSVCFYEILLRNFTLFAVLKGQINFMYFISLSIYCYTNETLADWLQNVHKHCNT